MDDTTSGSTSARRGGHSEASADAPRRVLLVDDDVDYAVFVRKLLARMGYGEPHIEVVHDETAARTSIDAREFDIIVSDLELRPGNGLAVLRHARTKWPEAQRILLTSAPDQARAELARESDLTHGIWDKNWKLGTIRDQLKTLLRPTT